MVRIDNTQYTSFTRCPMYWLEKYVNKVHQPVVGERDDALAIGVATHAALEEGYRNGNFTVPHSVLEEMPLTQEARLEVRSMVEAYRVAYPGGPVEFPWSGLEDPLDWTIGDITITAKLDGFFIIDQDTTVAGGESGYIQLAPGIYGFETKTKMPGIDRGLYMREWQANLQGSFQLLTLRELAREKYPDLPVRGIMLNVLERPKVYTPRKTCNGCKELLPVYTYTINGEYYICNRCQHNNKFKAAQIPEPRVDPPVLWRFLVERSDTRLNNDLYDIMTVATHMQTCMSNPEHAHANRNECVNAYKRKTCEYFEPHNAFEPVTAERWPNFVKFNPTAYLETKKE